MPGAFADERTGCATGLQDCSLPKALCFPFAWLLCNFTSTSLVIQEGWWAGTHTVILPCSVLGEAGGASKLCL